MPASVRSTDSCVAPVIHYPSPLQAQYDTNGHWDKDKKPDRGQLLELFSGAEISFLRMLNVVDEEQDRQCICNADWYDDVERNSP